MKYFDVHTHLNLPEFSADWKETAERARLAGVSFVNIGTDLDSSAKAITIAKALPGLAYATVGIHPYVVEKEGEQERLAELAQALEGVAIGECGFDRLSVITEIEATRQRTLFDWQLDLAFKLNKPLVIHCRESYVELLTVLVAKRDAGLLPSRIDIHFFSGDWTIAQQFLALGCYLSFTGVITFARAYDEMIKNIPLDRLLVETDAPYVAPVPYRGQRNEPAYVIEVVKAIARIRGEEEDLVAQTLYDNTHHFFGLD